MERRLDGRQLIYYSEREDEAPRDGAAAVSAGGGRADPTAVAGDPGEAAVPTVAGAPAPRGGADIGVITGIARPGASAHRCTAGVVPVPLVPMASPGADLASAPLASAPAASAPAAAAPALAAPGAAPGAAPCAAPGVPSPCARPLARVVPPDPAILVTGGCGYVAGPLVRRLVAAGNTVVVLDNLSTSSTRTLPVERTHLLRAAIGDALALRHIFARWRIMAVFHFAADSVVAESMRDPLTYYRHNVREGLTLLEGVVSACTPPPPFIFSSSASVYGIPEHVPLPESAPLGPVSAYAETKRALEAALHWVGQAHGLPWAALRYFNAAGADGPWEAKHPETHLIPLALAAVLGGAPLQVFGTDYPTRDGTAERDYVHVADLAAGHIAALRYLAEGGVSGPFNLGTGDGRTVAEVIATVEAVTGLPVPRIVSPRRPGDPPTSVADPGRARALLGWTAHRSSLREIVSDAWQAMQRAHEEDAR